ncbi:MAG TPA: hypothetical protein VMD75_15915 [Candidatus Binataceae bacterium]|nr:hypothetical protein [Candidatus Binataceae bacterium]
MRSKLPDSVTILSLVMRLLYRRFRRLVEVAFTRIEWNVGVTSVRDIDPRTSAEVKNVRWLPKERKKSYLADPFFFCSNDKIGLLAETIERKDQRGVIVGYEVTRERIVSLGVAIADRNIHLSYPYLFRWKGEIYCLPEQGEARTITLYRAVEFPKRWERMSTLFTGIGAADATIFRHNSYWWLSYTEAGIESNSRLMLWYATEPTGPWSSHARNPIKIDPRCSRGAGAPFVYDGMLIRPAQDCSVHYGAKIVFNRIIVLTPIDFEEEVIGELKPDPAGPYPRGLHTISQDGGVVVIDGWTRVFDPMGWYDELRSRRWERRRNAGRVLKTNEDGDEPAWQSSDLSGLNDGTSLDGGSRARRSAPPFLSTR